MHLQPNLFTVIVVLVLIAAIYGGFNQWGSRPTARGWSPLGVILLVLVILLLTGKIR